jgi:hypothetical protein
MGREGPFFCHSSALWDPGVSGQRVVLIHRSSLKKWCSQKVLQTSAPDTFLLRERLAGASELPTHEPQRTYSFVSFVAYAPHKLLVR